MKIYTKTGDDGSTSLFSGQRVSKHHLRVVAYGEVDELNAYLGLAYSQINANDPASRFKTDSFCLKSLLSNIQNELFTLGSVLASPVKNEYIQNLNEQHIQALEQGMDTMNESLSELKNFILPGGSTLASYLHIARTVCRRVERSCVLLNETENIDSWVLEYINRLSDFLFVAARFANHIEKCEEVIWKQA